jgi:hypothetical protein
MVVLSDLPNLIDYWHWLCACMIDCVPSHRNIVIQFSVCSNHFTYMCYLCYCCFLCLLYMWFAYVAQFVRLTHAHLISTQKLKQSYENDQCKINDSETYRFLSNLKMENARLKCSDESKTYPKKYPKNKLSTPN